jgi:phage recombination protein Bet
MSTVTALQTGGMSREQMQLLKDTIAKGTTDAEFQLFVAVCNRLRLDPFSRQIFLVKRWDSSLRREVATAQVSIDGFRLAAERTGEYEGQTQAQWCGDAGVWVEVWLDDKPPRAARVGVHRKGFREPLYAVARFDSYAQKTKDGHLTRMWSTMGDLMISKCAEALALRKAFPAELSGVYSTDEMAQAANDEPAIARPQRVNAPQPKALGPKAASIIDDIRGAQTMEELMALAVKAKEAGLDERSHRLAKTEWAARHSEIARAEMEQQEPPHDDATGEVLDSMPAWDAPQPATKQSATQRAIAAAKGVDPQ